MIEEGLRRPPRSLAEGSRCLWASHPKRELSEQIVPPESDLGLMWSCQQNVVVSDLDDVLKDWFPVPHVWLQIFEDSV